MTLKFWKVGCGDAITIRFQDEKKNWRHVFIDGGYVSTYRLTIKKELLQIQSDGEKVDLWIITHTDRDHIGGVEAFVKDPELTDKENLVSKYWFNWSTYTFHPLNSQISVRQGIRLRDYLDSTGKLKKDDIIASLSSVQFHGIELLLLSPDAEHLKRSKQEWKAVEASTLIASAINDHQTSISVLSKEPFEEDNDPFNGGSIALLWKGPIISILFLADSFPSVVIDSLRKLGYGLSNKLKVDYLKLSHHGSKRNFDPDILQYIDCRHFVVLANGITHSLPNKWTLSKIVSSPYRNSETIHFYFNDNTGELQSLFSRDDFEKYNFECHFNGGSFLKIEIND